MTDSNNSLSATTPRAPSAERTGLRPPGRIEPQGMNPVLGHPELEIEALLKQKALAILPKRLVCIALDDQSEAAPMIYHEEPIYRNGVIVGSTTSGAWGHRINRSLGLGYVKATDGVNKEWVESGTWEVELAWKRYPAKVQLGSFYDPKGEKIKA